MKTILMIKNVDTVIDRFFDPNLDMDSGMKKLFPRMSGKPISDLLLKYITAKMSSCYHSEAEGFVYAFNFINKIKPLSECGSYAIEDREISLDKIGMSKNPNSRKSNPKTPYPNLKYNHTLAIFPILRYGGAKALEEAIICSMSEEDHESGEWFHSSLGVWKSLVRWHVACFG